MAKTADELAIDLHDVAKVYQRKVHALRGVEMRVSRGEVFGLLGPNGAGKTTLVKIMMTVVRPTRAKGTVLGRRIGHKPTLRRIGYLPEDHRFPAYLTGREVLEYYAALSKVPRRTRKRRAAELLSAVGMTDWSDTRIAAYSKGMCQRVGLAQALMHDPELIVLDEPTDGLDPIGRRDVRAMLSHLRDEGRTVFINSHILSEVEMVCDRVAILNEGKVVRQGTLEYLTSRRLYDIEPDVPEISAAADVVRSALSTEPAEAVTVAGGVIRVAGVDAAGVQPAIDALRARGIVIRSFGPVRQSLEELFIETVSDGAKPGAPANTPPAPEAAS